MSNSEIKFEALQKKIKSDIKLLSTYQYDEVVSMGGYHKLLDDLKNVATEICKLEESMKQEEEKAIQEEERQQNMLQQKIVLKKKKKS